MDHENFSRIFLRKLLRFLLSEYRLMRKRTEVFMLEIEGVQIYPADVQLLTISEYVDLAKASTTYRLYVDEGQRIVVIDCYSPEHLDEVARTIIHASQETRRKVDASEQK